jgi:anaerobic magnesium-protoporphyrin IX monomethyl ester cyclase
MNFVFINPPYKIKNNNIWSVINSEIPPLGIALLAAIWDQQGHSSQIIDAAVLKLSIAEIISKINPNTDFVGITATTSVISDAIDIAQAVRTNFPNARIVMGGTHPTIFHRELVRDGICDMVIRNEGEIPVTELAKKTIYDLIPNLTWKNSKNEIVVNSDSSSYVDLDSLPFPAYDKIPMKLYHSALGAAKYAPSIGMVTSRGCPGKCTFCFSKMFGSQIRFISPARTIEHIEQLREKYGIREISFYDDTFTANKKNAAELCQLIINRKIKISWSCFTRVDSVTPELLKLMRKAGCHQIMYGFETTDERTLKHLNKTVNLNQFQKTIMWTKEANINIRGAFMLGNPGETETSMKNTIKFAKKSGLQFAVFNITTPYPGTEIYKEFLKNNSLIHQNWVLYDRAHPILKLDTVSNDVIMKYYYKSYRDFYLRPLYILQHLFNMSTFSEFLIYAKATPKIIRLLFKIVFRTQILQRDNMS